MALFYSIRHYRFPFGLHLLVTALRIAAHLGDVVGLLLTAGYMSPGFTALSSQKIIRLALERREKMRSSLLKGRADDGLRATKGVKE